jgi:sialate O-acetylesterase
MKNRSWIFLAGVLFLGLFTLEASAEVRLPKIFGDHMVLQRDVPVRIWGWAEPGERVQVVMQGQRNSTRTGRNGKWEITLAPLKTGGPYEMIIKGKNTITLGDILVGDVWLASGQSNMQWTVQQSANAAEEIKNADHPGIRLYTVSRGMSEFPLDDIEGGQWLVCLPGNIASFSAVAWYFGRKLHYELDVPIGLIASSWGGTVAEAWMSREAVSRHDDFSNTMLNTPFTIENARSESLTMMEQWKQERDNHDEGRKLNWHLPGLDDSDWQSMPLPGIWENNGLPAVDGVVWFRKEFNLTQEQAQKPLYLHLGRIQDLDETFVNGQLTGSMSGQGNLRNYQVDPSVLRSGRNVVSVRVTDTGGNGGITGPNLYALSETNIEFLSGNWKYKTGSVAPAPRQGVNPNSFPSLLYNAMINPVTRFAIRGTIWYQGESNAARAEQYRTLFPMLIDDWRRQWNQPHMPFLFVQLANFMQPDDKPTDSNWARLREAQKMTLNRDHTGMAVIIDIGEANDIHPQNKQDVGLRLALQALKISYGRQIVASGPVFSSMQPEGGSIRLSFESVGEGLAARDKYGYLKGFAVAGADKIFHWAEARIEGTQVVVSSPQVAAPVAVRYAWGNNPDDANLYNSENLPASPFRTDDW